MCFKELGYIAMAVRAVDKKVDTERPVDLVTTLSISSRSRCLTSLPCNASSSAGNSAGSSAGVPVTTSGSAGIPISTRSDWFWDGIKSTVVEPSIACVTLGSNRLLTTFDGVTHCVDH